MVKLGKSLDFFRVLWEDGGMIKRNITKPMLDILKKHEKIAFVSGPRQTGKTTFSEMILGDFFQGTYVSWDIITDQKRILQNPYFFEEENRDPSKKFLVIFDEIHKYANWKNYLKGCYDKYKKDFAFIATGSGRLDMFTKGGESLFGRYFPLKLLPLSVGELRENEISWKLFEKSFKEGFKTKKNDRKNYEKLFKISGFPETFLKNDIAFYNIWSSERKKTLVREDIRSAYAIREISNIEILSNLLPDKVGSTLSVNSLREDLGVSFDSVKKWLLILEQFYYFFSIPPYSKSISRAIKKEKKIYLYDWVEIDAKPQRFENIVAFHLYKAVSLWKNLGIKNIDLHYIRDKDGREVDFLMTKNKSPYVLIETKYKDTNISKNLLHFQEKTNTPVAIQLVHQAGVYKKTQKNKKTQYIMSTERFLASLP